MNKAVGVYVWISENQVGDYTAAVVGEGELKTGPVDGSQINFAEEGAVALNYGKYIVNLFTLDIPESPLTKSTMEKMNKNAEFVAKSLGRRIELVYFGPNGREHVKWLPYAL